MVGAAAEGLRAGIVGGVVRADDKYHFGGNQLTRDNGSSQKGQGDEVAGGQKGE